MKVGYIQTKFYDDPFVQGLLPLEKFLFIYLRTNSHFSICGIYEITIKTISFETGISEKEVTKILEKFAHSKKIFYNENYICLVNLTKNLYKPNDNLVKGIEKEKSLLPSHILDYFNNLLQAPPSPLQAPPTITPSPSPSPSITTNVVQPVAEKVEYGNPEINKFLEAIKKLIGLEDFAGSQKFQRIYAKHCLNLIKKIGREEFRRRVEILVQDDFKRKRCNEIKFIYEQIKGWIEPKPSIAFIS